MNFPAYSYYELQHCGSLPRNDYLRLVRRAAAYLDQVTFGRSSRTFPPALTCKVNDATCAVVDELYRQEQGEVISASNDGYTESYATSSRSDTQKLYGIAQMYLGVTGLLYRGVMY